MIEHSVKVSSGQLAYWFIVSQGRLFLTADGTVPFTELAALPLQLADTMICNLGEYQQQPCCNKG